MCNTDELGRYFYHIFAVDPNKTQISAFFFNQMSQAEWGHLYYKSRPIGMLDGECDDCKEKMPINYSLPACAEYQTIRWLSGIRNVVIHTKYHEGKCNFSVNVSKHCTSIFLALPDWKRALISKQRFTFVTYSCRAENHVLRWDLPIGVIELERVFNRSK